MSSTCCLLLPLPDPFAPVCWKRKICLLFPVSDLWFHRHLIPFFLLQAKSHWSNISFSEAVLYFCLFYALLLHKYNEINMRHEYKSTCLCQAFSHAGCSRSILHGTNLEQSEPCFPLWGTGIIRRDVRRRKGREWTKRFLRNPVEYPGSRGCWRGEHPSSWGGESLVTVFNSKLSDLCGVCCAGFSFSLKLPFFLVQFLVNSSFFL